MFKDRDAMATLAVRDITKAREFYEGTLGLKRADEAREQGDHASVYRTGASTVLVYLSRYAGTNQATAASWNVGDELEEIVRDLKGKGVTFEHYDMPEMKREGDIHVAGPMKVAWFKDPDGNILALVSD